MIFRPSLTKVNRWISKNVFFLISFDVGPYKNVILGDPKNGTWQPVMSTTFMWPPYWIQSKTLKSSAYPILVAKLPNRKSAHIFANLWSIDIKLPVSAYSHALVTMTWRLHGNYALLCCLAPSSLLAAIFCNVFGCLWSVPEWTTPLWDGQIADSVDHLIKTRTDQ